MVTTPSNTDESIGALSQFDADLGLISDEQTMQITEAAFAEQSAFAPVAQAAGPENVETQQVVEQTASSAEGIQASLDVQTGRPQTPPATEAGIQERTRERVAEERRNIADARVRGVEQREAVADTQFDRTVALAEARGRLQPSAQAKIQRPTARLNPMMMRLKAWEQRENEYRSGRVSSSTLVGSSDLAGDTGRRRRSGEQIVRMTPEAVFETAQKINSVLQTGQLPAGQMLTVAEIENVRSSMDNTRAGRQFLDDYDNKKRQVEEAFVRESVDFDTFDDIEGFLNLYRNDPVVSDFAQNYVSENIDERMKARLQQGQQNVDEARRKLMEQKLESVSAQQTAKKLASADDLPAPMSRSDQAAQFSIYFYRQDGKWKKHTEADSKKLKEDYLKTTVADRSLPAIAHDVVNGYKPSVDLVNEYKESGNQLGFGDLIGGYKYEAKLIPKGADVTVSSDADNTAQVDRIAEALNNDDDFASTADVTKHVDDFVRNVLGLEGNEAKSKSNELGRMLVERLNRGVAGRAQAFAQAMNAQLSASTEKLSLKFTARDNMDPTALSGEAVNIMKSQNMFAEDIFAGTAEQQIAGLTDNMINEMAGRDMINQLTLQGVSDPAQLNVIQTQIDRLKSGSTPEETLDPDVVASFKQTVGILQSERNKALSSLQDQQAKMAQATEERRIKEQEERQKKVEANEQGAVDAFKESAPVNKPGTNIPYTMNNVVMQSIPGTDEVIYAFDQESARLRAWASAPANAKDPDAIRIQNSMPQTTGGISYAGAETMEALGLYRIGKPADPNVAKDTELTQMWRRAKPPADPTQNSTMTLQALSNNVDNYVRMSSDDATTQREIGNTILVSNDEKFVQAIKDQSTEAMSDALKDFRTPKEGGGGGEKIDKAYQQAILSQYQRSNNVRNLMNSEDPTKRRIGVMMAISNARDDRILSMGQSISIAHENGKQVVSKYTGSTDNRSMYTEAAKNALGSDNRVWRDDLRLDLEQQRSLILQSISDDIASMKSLGMDESDTNSAMNDAVSDINNAIELLGGRATDPSVAVDLIEDEVTEAARRFVSEGHGPADIFASPGVVEGAPITSELRGEAVRAVDNRLKEQFGKRWKEAKKNIIENNQKKYDDAISRRYQEAFDKRVALEADRIRGKRIAELQFEKQLEDIEL